MPEQGLDHPEPMPDTPPADTLPDFTARMGPYADALGGLGRGSTCTSDGQLAVTVAQEGLIRVTRR
ncbi:MAG: hypothetical protein Q8K58_07180 [Acidimicrobiales bacterium]|nr:hypothetical protein [Acidimicrobiales bacterium]